MELELKHLAPYLPYKLKGICTEEFAGIETVYGINQYRDSKNIYLITSFDDLDIEMFKPILRPLDLAKEITHNGETFVPLIELEKIRKNIQIYQPINIDIPIEINIQTEDYSQEVDMYDGYLIVEKLFEWHFDVFRLIEKGLAIDVNTLK